MTKTQLKSIYSFAIPGFSLLSLVFLTGFFAPVFSLGGQTLSLNSLVSPNLNQFANSSPIDPIHWQFKSIAGQSSSSDVNWQAKPQPSVHAKPPVQTAVNSANLPTAGDVVKQAPQAHQIDLINIEQTVTAKQDVDLTEDHERSRIGLQIAYEPKEIIKPTGPIPNLDSDPKSTDQLGSSSVYKSQNLPPNPSTEMYGFTASSLRPGSTSVDVNQAFTVTFDTSVTPDLADALQFDPPANFDKQINGNQVTIYPKRLKRLTNYKFGIKSVSYCKLTNLSPCQLAPTTYTHLLSFQTSFKESYIYGRSVWGYTLGAAIYGRDDADKTIMLTGGIHGLEWRSGALDNLINYLNNHPNEILNSNKKIIIAGDTNPDGRTLNIRYNANRVDLNRNFATNPWGFERNQGPFPFSEPESKALAEFTLAEKVDYLISYHAQWPPKGIIFRGDDNNPATQNFAKWVSERTGYPVGYYPNAPYVSGDQTVWAEQQGIPSLIIEARSIHSSDQDINFPMQIALIRDF
jgi:hypothetical protein